MADIGDKSFTTEMVQEIKRAVIAELGSNAFVDRYLATVSAVDTTTSEVTVYLSGSDQTSSGFRARGILMPSVNDQVIACVDGQDRWIENVVRPTTSTPYLTLSSASGVPAGTIAPYVGTTAPNGWLMCDGTQVSRTTYSALFEILGTKAGAGDGSTTFNLPDLKDRFLGGNLATSTGYAQNAGTIKPNTAFSTAQHNHTGPSHSHSWTGTAHNHTFGSHTHDVTGTSGSTTVGSTTRGFGSYSTSYDSGHTHGAGSYAGAAATGSSGNATATGTIGNDGTGNTGNATPAVGTTYAGLVNFIIKT